MPLLYVCCRILLFTVFGGQFFLCLFFFFGLVVRQLVQYDYDIASTSFKSVMRMMEIIA